MREIDLGNPATYEGRYPYEWFAHMRTEAPVAWHFSQYLGRGFWVVGASKPFDMVMTDSATFSSERTTVTLNEPDAADMAGRRLFLINMDPPLHSQYRRIVGDAFRSSALAYLAPVIQETVYRLVARVEPNTPFDFVGEIANELSLEVACKFMGVERNDRCELGRYAEAINFPDDPDLHPPGTDLRLTPMRIFERGTDLLRRPEDEHHLSLRTVLRSRLSQVEFYYFFILILSASFITTKSVLTSAMALLAQHPVQLGLLHEHTELIPNAVEEILRMEPPQICFCRTATRDVTTLGVNIKRGDKIAMFHHSVNRDETLNATPDRFDVLRTQIRHRSFGHGVHYCLGAWLARLEIQGLLREIVERGYSIRVVGEPVRAKSNFLRAYKRMSVILERP